MFDNLRADLERFTEECPPGAGLRSMLRGICSQGFQAICVYRFFRWFAVLGMPSQPLRFFVERMVEITTGISIPAAAQIGKGLRIHHFGGVIFHSDVKMGDHCTIYQGVTVGDKGGYGPAPRIGDNVTIGAGAKVIGDIEIGNNVTIGANAVVVTPLPDNAVAVGIPARVVGTNRSVGAPSEVNG